VCKVKNIDLLPDADTGVSNAEPKDTPVFLSFGYQKDQSTEASQNDVSLSKCSISF
jgi:hypothetical protein